MLVGLMAVATWASKAEAAPRATLLTVSGIINPVSAEYLSGRIKEINGENSADIIVIQLDTPGGLDASMRIIVKDIIGSAIPVAVWVGPAGSRAASAGTFISLSAHVSAMAKGTTQGAASPVPAQGGSMSRTMEKKVKNDAAAYIRSLAEMRGRNGDWAVKAVTEAASVDEKLAVKMNVTDFIANSIDELLEKADGRKVNTPAGEVTIKSLGATVTHIEMTERERFLDIISNPTVAYILLMLGFYGLFFELSNPGVILPGIVGGICIILGFYAMQSLPINYAGILLLLLAVLLFLAELFVPSVGALTLGGVVAMILGGVMLIDSPEDYMQVKMIAVVPVAVGIGGLFFGLVSWAILAKPKKVATGVSGLIGEPGLAETDIAGIGQVTVNGEIWEAYANEPIPKGRGIVVLEKNEHRLLVEPAPEGGTKAGEEA